MLVSCQNARAVVPSRPSSVGSLQLSDDPSDMHVEQPTLYLVRYSHTTMFSQLFLMPSIAGLRPVQFLFVYSSTLASARGLRA